MTQALATVQYRATEIDTQKLGEIFVKSGFFQDTRDAAQAIVKILAGRELGFGPLASMQGVYIVKGRVTLSANLVGAAIQRSGTYRYMVKELTNERCVLHFYTDRDKSTFDSVFTMDDAKAAGIASDTYRKFPRNMLFARALTNGARWFCPEVFNGPIYTPEELGAEVNDEGVVIEALGNSQPFQRQPTRDELQRAGAIAREALEARFGGPEPAPAADEDEPYVPTDIREVDDTPRAEPESELQPEPYKCDECGASITSKTGEKINDDQADVIVERFGKLVCRAHMPRKSAA